ncbi:MAG: acyl carrier protein [Ruminococcus sp.]|nr:acyl carrier protein [Ruminococcus sp.]
MTREKIFDKLNRVFQDVFDNETLELEDNTTADDIEDWDSLTHIDLVVAVEKEFGIKFSMGEVRKLQNVGEMVDIILKRI